MLGKRNKQRKKSTPGHFDTLVSNKTSLTGDVVFSGGLHIDGKITGTVRAEEGSDAVLRISEVGEVDGDIHAPHIIVNGTVRGDVHSSKDLELAPKASIHGNVYYNLLEMAMGAEVNGSLMHRQEGDREQPMLKSESRPTLEAPEDTAGESDDEANARATTSEAG